jgi:hypothetical protein
MSLSYSEEMTLFLNVNGTDHGTIKFEELCEIDASGQLETPIKLKTDWRAIIATLTIKYFIYDHTQLAEITTTMIKDAHFQLVIRDTHGEDQQ